MKQYQPLCKGRSIIFIYDNIYHNFLISPPPSPLIIIFSRQQKKQRCIFWYRYTFKFDHLHNFLYFKLVCTVNSYYIYHHFFTPTLRIEIIMSENDRLPLTFWMFDEFFFNCRLDKLFIFCWFLLVLWSAKRHPCILWLQNLF